MKLGNKWKDGECYRQEKNKKSATNKKKYKFTVLPVESHPATNVKIEDVAVRKKDKKSVTNKKKYKFTVFRFQNMTAT